MNAMVAGVAGPPSQRRAQRHIRPGPSSGCERIRGARNSSAVWNPMPVGNHVGPSSTSVAFVIAENGPSHRGDSAGGPTVGGLSKNAVGMSSVSRPVAPSEANMTSPAASVPVTLT